VKFDNKIKKVNGKFGGKNISELLPEILFMYVKKHKIYIVKINM